MDSQRRSPGRLFHFYNSNISSFNGRANYKGLLTCPTDIKITREFFTKFLKPVYGFLRQQRHLSAVFVEDSYLQGDTYPILKSTQGPEFLGFIFNSMSMTFSINEEKATSIISKVTKLLCNDALKIVLASAIGSSISLFPAIPL